MKGVKAYSTSTEKNSSIDLESTGHMTWKLLQKNLHFVS